MDVSIFEKYSWEVLVNFLDTDSHACFFPLL